MKNKIKEFCRRLIVKSLFVPFVKDFSRQLLLRKLGDNDLWGGKSMEYELETNIKRFMSQEEIKDEKRISKIKKDIIDSYFIYDALPQEYFLFDFMNIPHSRRKEFLTNAHKDKMAMANCPLSEFKEKLRDKYNFYKIYKDFFKRDVCRCQEKEDLAEFVEVANRHEKLFVKPLSGMCGVGAEIVNTRFGENEKLFEEIFLKYKGGGILEELIEQSDIMKQWNPSSVNTVRIPSFLNGDEFTIFKPFFRAGRKGYIVDNAACNGLICSIDEKTGVISSKARDESGNYYDKHPDSGITIKGWQVPEWENLKTLAYTLHKKLPQFRYIGWDFAYTDKGWVLIEGDWGQFVTEFSDQQGIKKKFDELMM